MLVLLQDALDLARLRVRPLAHYVYVYWQPALWLTGMACVQALFAEGLKASLLERLAFFVVLTWAQVVVLVLFFTWWLSLRQRWNRQGSLFPLAVLASSLQFVEPLLALLPADLAVLCVLMLGVYQVVVLIRALSVATGVTTRHVVGGMLVFLPMALLLSLMALQFTVSAGWMTLPSPALTLPSTPSAGTL